MITNFETTNVLNAQIMGLSTDTKPTIGVQPNSLFWELDTNGMYFFDGTQWQSIGVPEAEVVAVLVISARRQ